MPSGLGQNMLKLGCARKPILQQISARSVPRNPFESRRVAYRGELGYSWASDCEHGTASVTTQSRAYRLSLAPCGRGRRVDCVVCVPGVSVGDEADLR